MNVTATNPIGWIVGALRTGETSLLPGKPPAYARLDTAARDAAVRRGAGRTAAQPFTMGDAAGTQRQEPVNLVVTGSLAQLQAKLQQAGWTKADARSPLSFAHATLTSLFGLGDYQAAPVSEQFLDGKGEVLALSKNSDHDRARDHLRVYALAPDPVSGQPRWGIAGTRDVALSLKTSGHLEIGHAIDFQLDGERDQIMHDLLRAGVTQWAAVRGVRQGGPADVAVPGGFLVGGQYVTDGLVYEVRL